MANTKQATKRARQNTKNRSLNMSKRSALATAVKNVIKTLASDAAKAKDALSTAVKKLDIAARKGLIHPNRAARLKSRLNKKVKAAAAA